MTDREQRLMSGLRAFGWAIADPWFAEKPPGDVWTVVDAGPTCPVCGKAAPDTGKWPEGVTYADPGNHMETCAFAELLREK